MKSPLALAFAIVALTLLAPACRRRTAGATGAASTASASAGTDPASSGAATPSGSAASAALGELESHLSYGRAWGADPIAQALAQKALRVARESSAAETRELAVAVRIVPAEPRQVVVLVRLRDLRDEGNSDRKDILDDLRTEIGEGLSADDQLTVALLGRTFYGAVAQGTRAAYRTRAVGRIVGSAPVAAALAAKALPTSEGPIALGQTVRVGSQEWTVKEAKSLGKAVHTPDRDLRTAGRFVVVRYVVTNRGKKPLAGSHVVRLVDDRGREFGPHDATDDLVGDRGGGDYEGFELQPDIAHEFSRAYELPDDARGLRVKIKGPDYWPPGLVALSL